MLFIRKLVLSSAARRTAYSRGAIRGAQREGPRTPEAELGKDRVLPRRNSGGATREAKLGRDQCMYFVWTLYGLSEIRVRLHLPLASFHLFSYDPFCYSHIDFPDLGYHHGESYYIGQETRS